MTEIVFDVPQTDAQGPHKLVATSLNDTEKEVLGPDPAACFFYDPERVGDVDPYALLTSDQVGLLREVGLLGEQIEATKLEVALATLEASKDRPVPEFQSEEERQLTIAANEAAQAAAEEDRFVARARLDMLETSLAGKQGRVEEAGLDKLSWEDRLRGTLLGRIARTSTGLAKVVRLDLSVQRKTVGYVSVPSGIQMSAATYALALTGLSRVPSPFGDVSPPQRPVPMVNLPNLSGQVDNPDKVPFPASLDSLGMAVAHQSYVSEQERSPLDQALSPVVTEIPARVYFDHSDYELARELVGTYLSDFTDIAARRLDSIATDLSDLVLKKLSDHKGFAANTIVELDGDEAATILQAIKDGPKSERERETVVKVPAPGDVGSEDTITVTKASE